MELPKISIITITYNSAKTLRRTIDSVIGQGYDALEYILVDGGSTDGTVDIIRSYGDKISRWISEPDRGISDAFNKGIAMASGNIIGLINSDDGLLPGALKAIADAYDPDIDVYLGKLMLWDVESDTRVIDSPSLHYNNYDANHICHASMFVSKRAYEKYGTYNINCKYVMDYELILRFQKMHAKFKMITVPLAFFTLGGITPAHDYDWDRLKETEHCLRENGANTVDIMLFYTIKGIKWFVKKLIGKRNIMKIRYQKTGEDLTKMRF